MRVALVTSLERGGPLEHALVLARALRDEGAEVQAVCAGPALGERFESAGARPVVLPLRHPLDVSHGLRLRRALAGADVVHSHDRRSGLWTRALPRPGDAVLVHSIHGLPDPYLPFPAGPHRPGLRAVVAYRGADAGLARRADGLVTPSRAVADVLVRRLGIPARKLTVIANAIASGPPAPAATPGETVGTLSVLEPVKALDVLLEAAALLEPSRPGLRFLVAGTGSQSGALQRRARELGIAAKVSFPGFVPAREALAQMRVFALPSLMENCPMALLEAMAAGVPAVASRVGGVPEVAPDGTATLVPPSDPAALAEAIAALLDDPSATTEQATAAREHVASYASPQRMATRMLDLYATLARRRGR